MFLFVISLCALSIIPMPSYAAANCNPVGVAQADATSGVLGATQTINVLA